MDEFDPRLDAFCHRADDDVRKAASAAADAVARTPSTEAPLGRSPPARQLSSSASGSVGAGAGVRRRRVVMAAIAVVTRSAAVPACARLDQADQRGQPQRVEDRQPGRTAKDMRARQPPRPGGGQTVMGSSA
jgi:hypothetical protein